MFLSTALSRVVPRAAGVVACRSHTPVATCIVGRWLSFQSNSNGGVTVSHTKIADKDDENTDKSTTPKPDEDPIKVSACGDLDNEDDEMEEEEMFVDPHESLGHKKREWGSPTRGGRYAEPTRFGDWERNGRCSDF